MTVFLHVAFGSIALAAVPAALWVRKGPGLHRIFGRTFLWAMAVVLLTAQFMWQKKGHFFLVPLSIVTVFLIYSGYRALSRRGRRPAGPAWAAADLGAGTIAAATGAFVYFYWQGATGGLMLQLRPVFVGIGTIAICFALSDFLGYALPRSKTGWILSHFSGMLASYISAVTAFVVINAHGVPMVLRWLVPSAIGAGSIITYSLRTVRLRPSNLIAVLTARGRPAAPSQPIAPGLVTVRPGSNPKL